jgi:hypothetical protein
MCQGNRTLYTNGSCICNNSNYFYDVGVIQCSFVCPNGYIDSSYSCILCSNLFGSECSNCTLLNCLACNSNYHLINNSCACSGDRVMSGSTCQICSNIFQTKCETCTSIACTGCLTNYQLVKVNNVSICENCSVLFGSRCLNCSASECFYC